jgi:hypothetical protein
MNFRERIVRKLAGILHIEEKFFDFTDFKEQLVMKLKRGLKDHHSLRGNFHFKLTDGFGNIKQEFDVANTVTELGDAMVADAMSDRGVTLPTHIAVGTGVAGGAGATTLTNEIHKETLDSTTQGAAGDDNDVIWVGTFAAGHGTGALTEAGIFNAAPANTGVMPVISGFAVINKGAADSLEITWTLTCGAS